MSVAVGAVLVKAKRDSWVGEESFPPDALGTLKPLNNSSEVHVSDACFDGTAAVHHNPELLGHASAGE